MKLPNISNFYPDWVFSQEVHNPEWFLPKKWQYLKVETVMQRPRGWSINKVPQFQTPEAVTEFIADILSDLELSDRERMYSVLVDNSLRVLALHEVSVGSATETLAPPKELFRAAIIANAAGIFIVHNHPSGKLEFSAADRAVMQRLKKVGELMDVKVFDFIIIGHNGAFVSANTERLL